MNTLASLLTALVACEHIGFMVLESLLWRKPVGRKVFGLTPERAEMTAALAANQGLYNGFLAAGLIWALWEQTPDFAHALAVFFLSCMIVAAVFGALTVKRTILLIQGLPATLALAALLLGR